MLAITEDTHKQLEEQLDEINFSCAIIALTMLRYMTDHMEKLHVSVVQRLVNHHDFVSLLVPLLDTAPWYKKTIIKVEIPPEEGESRGAKKKKVKKKVKHEKFSDNKWSICEANDRVICKPEAQVWLALYNLIMSAGRAEHGFGYHIDNHKKETISRLKKFLNDVLCDQLPPMTQLRRVVEEVSMMQCAPDPGSSFVIEQVSEMRDAMLQGRDWEALARQQLTEFFTMTQKERMDEVMRMNDLYSSFDLGAMADGGKPSESMLLEKHGALGLAKLYLTGGQGLDKDFGKAAGFFRLAAEKGDAEAQYCLGQRLKKGQGVKQDLKEAEEWFVKAAEQSHANAMNWLAHMYEKGDGVDQCTGTAVSWNEKAALAGDSWAQTKMGMRLLKGEGLPQDLGKAKGWLQVAASGGSKAAAEKLSSGELDKVEAVEPPKANPKPKKVEATAKATNLTNSEEAAAIAALEKAREATGGSGPSTEQMRAFLNSAEGSKLIAEAIADENADNAKESISVSGQKSISKESIDRAKKEPTTELEPASLSSTSPMLAPAPAPSLHCGPEECTDFDDLD